MKNTKFTQEQIAELTNLTKTKIGKDGRTIITSPVRISFPRVSEPRKINGKDIYEVCIMIASEDTEKALMVMVNNYKKEVFPDFDTVRLPFQKQETLSSKYQGFEDGLFFNASSSFSVNVVSSDKTKLTKEQVKERLYGGVWAICSLSLYKYGKDGKFGIGFNLRNIMLVADDIKFESTEPKKDDFEGIKIVGKFNVPSPDSFFKEKEDNTFPVNGLSPADLVDSGWTKDLILKAGYTESQCAKYGI